MLRTELHVVPAQNGEAPVVCVIDDDASVLRATGRLLLSAQWNVELFSDPQAFLDYAQSNRPPVAVIDVDMPVMNGLQVQERLREISPTTCTVFVSSVADPAVREKAMNAGASAYYLKPMDGEELLAAIANACGLRDTLNWTASVNRSR
jgi:FixJ family two-component response regulator